MFQGNNFRNKKTNNILFTKDENRMSSPANYRIKTPYATDDENMSRDTQDSIKSTNTNIKTLNNTEEQSKINTYVQEAISVTSLMNNQNIPLSLSNLSVYFPQYETTKCSNRSIGNIAAYAVNTYQGIIRNYNEDRVSIILNIAKPQTFQGNWPRCSFFGIYDGHGGASCSDFLRDQLHTYVIKDPNFPNKPKEALEKGFEKAEADFINNHALSKNKDILDRSGSCAIVVLIIEDMCYVANVGDSRAVMSLNSGKDVSVLSNDHKPNEDGENKRILENGGKVYQTQTPTKLFNIQYINSTPNTMNQVLIGPYRVFPGRLSVSRTFGDVEAKVAKFGGIPGVVIAEPEIHCFKISSDMDFLVMGCDGIFDQISNQEIVDCVWMTMNDGTRTKDLNSQCAVGADMIMKSSLVRRTLDNVTVLMIAFHNLERVFSDTILRKHEKYSPKSSYYLYNVIENKENSSTEPAPNYYCVTEPAIIVHPDKHKISPSNKISRNGIPKKNLSVEKDGMKAKCISPTSKDNHINKNRVSNGLINVNYVNNNKNTISRLNKVLSFEINKKIVLSPKTKNDQGEIVYNNIEIATPVNKNYPLDNDRYSLSKKIAYKNTESSKCLIKQSHLK